uniref:Uncharacterized protein n=1 Tax=Rhizophora mucronata TaxID=61149 RepID=A0A2P2PH24_RHIMU
MLSLSLSIFLPFGFKEKLFLGCSTSVGDCDPITLLPSKTYVSLLLVHQGVV